VPADGGKHYVMYSTLPGLHILNGHLQAITGLRDLAVLTGDPVALRAYRDGERAARAELRLGDTGAWSLYGLGGAESSLSYHQLTRTFLGNLCRRTNRLDYCDGRKRFDRYLREPPALRISLPPRVKRGRPAGVAFTLSKVSDVTVAVRDRRGTLLRRRFRAQRGTHGFAFRPMRRGRVDVTVAATSLSGVRASASRRVRVSAPRSACASPARAGCRRSGRCRARRAGGGTCRASASGT